MSTRKVSFFHLALSMNINETRAFIDRQSVKTYFESIYRSILETQTVPENNVHAKLLPNGNNDIVVEIISYDKNEQSAALKIGYLNPSTITDLRDPGTLQTEEIKLKNNQKVETYTCCYIDFTTNIVSYINVMSAPRISALELFFNECLKDRGITATLSAIACPTEGLRLECTRVTKLEIAFAVPNEEKLANDFGLPQKLFESVHNAQTFNATYTIRAKRNFTLFDDLNDLLAFRGILKNSMEHRPTKVKATTKKGKNAPQIVDLLLETYTYTDSITLDENQSLDHSNTISTLRNCYGNSVSKLIPFIHGKLKKKG